LHAYKPPHLTRGTFSVARLNSLSRSLR
jgi:hypothetical protein